MTRLVPTTLVDLHAHLLPAVDDGPRSMQETVEMLRLAFSDGTRTLVATPHMYSSSFPNTDSQAMQVAFARTVSQLEHLSRHPEWAFLSRLELCLGAENQVTGEFLEALERGQVLGLNSGPCLLVEFSPHLSWDMVRAACHRILAKGYTPVLAHVERYRSWAKEARVRELVERGCRIQVNGESFLARRGTLRRTSYALLRKGLVHVVASDNHKAGAGFLPLSRVWQRLAKAASPQVADALMVHNPKAMLRVTRPEPGPRDHCGEGSSVTAGPESVS